MQEYSWCVVSHSDVSWITLDPSMRLSEARAVFGNGIDGCLFLQLVSAPYKPIHPSDEGKFCISNISTGFIAFKREEECGWPRCAQCSKVLKEYPNKAGGLIQISLAQFDFQYVHQKSVKQEDWIVYHKVKVTQEEFGQMSLDQRKALLHTFFCPTPGCSKSLRIANGQKLLSG